MTETEFKDLFNGSALRLYLVDISTITSRLYYDLENCVNNSEVTDKNKLRRIIADRIVQLEDHISELKDHFSRSTSENLFR